MKAAFGALFFLAIAPAIAALPLKPDLKVTGLKAVPDGKRTVIEVSVMNDSIYEFGYPGYQVFLTVFEDSVERTTMEPDFGRWRSDETKTFRLPVDVVKGRSYRVLLRAEGLFGESNKDNNVMEAVLMPDGSTPAPAPQPTPAPAPTGSLRVTPATAWAGSPVILEADKQGAVKFGDLPQSAAWTKGNGVDHTGSGVSAVVTLPASLKPGPCTVTVTATSGQAIGMDILVLAPPPRIVEVVGTPVPGKTFTVIADNVDPSQLADLTLRAGDNTLKPSSHSVRKDGSFSLNFTAPVNQYSGPVTLEYKGASSSVWDMPRILFAGRPDIWSASTTGHAPTQGAVSLVWGEGLSDAALTWFIDGRQATVLSSLRGARGEFALIGARNTSGSTLEARAGKTRAAWLELANTGAGAAPPPMSAKAPVVEDFDPGAVRVGENLTITGKNLGTARKVTVGGGLCDILDKGDTRITVRVGTKATTGAIVVETDGGSTTSDLSVVVR